MGSVSRQPWTFMTATRFGWGRSRSHSGRPLATHRQSPRSSEIFSSPQSFSVFRPTLITTSIRAVLSVWCTEIHHEIERHDHTRWAHSGRPLCNTDSFADHRKGRIGVIRAKRTAPFDEGLLGVHGRGR